MSRYYKLTLVIFSNLVKPISYSGNKYPYRVGKIVFLMSSIFVNTFSSNADSFKYDSELNKLYCKAAKSFNFCVTEHSISLLEKCQQLEEMAKALNDIDNLFIIQQMATNAHSLNGDFTLAFIKASHLYNYARKTGSDLGIALSMQAVGNIYMHSGQLKKAAEAYDEAIHQFGNNDNYLVKVRLFLQRAHVEVLLDKEANVDKYLEAISDDSRINQLPCSIYYKFYLDSYTLLCDYKSENGITDIEQLNRYYTHYIDSKIFRRYNYFIKYFLFQHAGNYKEALIYCDSIHQFINLYGNQNENKNHYLRRASLLAEIGEKQNALEIYNNVKVMADSISDKGYIDQIDSLHIRYRVDILELNSVSSKNRLFEIMIIIAMVALIAISWMIFMIIKNNRLLRSSRDKMELARQHTNDSIKVKSLFLSNMSHELRTPLSGIVSFCDLLSNDYVEDLEEKKKIASYIKQNTDLLLKLFSDVVDAANLKSKSIKFTYERVDLVLLCQSALDTVKKAKEPTINILFHSDFEKLELTTDPSRLQQVIINLLVNAVKFTVVGHISLSIKIDNKSNEVVFMVEDTGIGIPADKQSCIFERFEKIDETSSGTGLGLSICQLILNNLGGRIWIDSSYNDGARFFFTHPFKILK